VSPTSAVSQDRRRQDADAKRRETRRDLPALRQTFTATAHLRDRAALYPGQYGSGSAWRMGDEAPLPVRLATRKATRTGVRTPPTRGTAIYERGGRTPCALDLDGNAHLPVSRGRRGDSWSSTARSRWSTTIVGNAWELGRHCSSGTTAHHTTRRRVFRRGSRAAEPQTATRDTLKRGRATGPSRSTRSLGNGWLCKSKYDNDYYYQANRSACCDTGAGDWNRGAYGDCSA